MSKKPATPRNIRLCDQIKKEVSVCLVQQIKDPRVRWVQITDVELTPDYAHATLSFSVLDPEEFDRAQKGLNACSGLLRREIGRHIVMHTLPQLHFKPDRSILIREEMNTLIDQAMERTRQSDDAENSSQIDDELGSNAH